MFWGAGHSKVLPCLFHSLSQGHQLPGPSDILPLVSGLHPLSQEAYVGYDSFAHLQKEIVYFDQDFDQVERVNWEIYG